MTRQLWIFSDGYYQWLGTLREGPHCRKRPDPFEIGSGCMKSEIPQAVSIAVCRALLYCPLPLVYEMFRKIKHILRALKLETWDWNNANLRFWLHCASSKLGVITVFDKALMDRGLLSLLPYSIFDNYDVSVAQDKTVWHGSNLSVASFSFFLALLL
jgi:hypothetical protein